MPLFIHQDPVQLYIQGKITEEKLQKRLKRLNRGVISYMDLLPAAEHRIILAESGVEMKRPHYMRQ